MMTALMSSGPEEDPGRGGVAVRERPTSHRACRRVRSPVRCVRPLSPLARRRRAHGLRDGRARNADHGRRRREGVSPRELVDRNNAVIREDLRRLGLSYDLFTRTTTLNHHRVVRDLFRTLWEKGYIVERRRRRVLCHDRADVAGPVHRGHVPALRLPRSARRPVRQLWQATRPEDLIEPRSKVDGTPPVFRETSHLFLDLPAFAEQLAPGSSRRTTGGRTSGTSRFSSSTS